MSYVPHYRPPALFYSVAQERLWRWGSADGYAAFLRKHYTPLAVNAELEEDRSQEMTRRRSLQEVQKPSIRISSSGREEWSGRDSQREPTERVLGQDYPLNVGTSGSLPTLRRSPLE